MPSIALYYPWMHFQDDNWVKLALLTWDNLARIRPNELPTRDSELVRHVHAESNLITELTPSEHDLIVVAELFTEVLGTHRKRIVRRFGGLSRRTVDDRYQIANSNVGSLALPARPGRTR